VEKGLLFKLDSFHQIQLGTVYRGRKKLDDETVLRLYKRRNIPVSYLGKFNLGITFPVQLNFEADSNDFTG